MKSIAPESSAALIYSNFGPADSFGNTVHDILNLNGAYLEHAAGFVVPSGANFTVTRVDLPIHEASSNSQISLALWTDSSGRPGSILESILADVLAQSPAKQIQSIAASGTTVLYGGNTYWLSASATTSGRIAWFTNSIAAGRYAAIYDSTHDPSSWILIDDGLVAPQGAFRLVGEPLPVPEPGASLLILLGLLSIVVARARTMPNFRLQRTRGEAARCFAGVASARR